MVDVYRYRRLGRRLACANRLFEVFFDTVETPSGEIVDDFLVVRPNLSAPKGIVGGCVLPEVIQRDCRAWAYIYRMPDLLRDVWPCFTPAARDLSQSQPQPKKSGRGPLSIFLLTHWKRS